MLSRVLLLLGVVCGSARVTAGKELRKVASGGLMYVAAPQERGSYSQGSPGGRYNYGYNTGDGIAKVEVRQPDGSVVGSYRYFDPNGKQVVRSYIADKRGFRVLGNDLPISPDTPASQVEGWPALTAAVEGTDEFQIPPPLGPPSSSLTPPSSFQSPQQQDAYTKQLQQLQEQRRQLQIQQEKLEALQKQLESQQQKWWSQYKPASPSPQHKPAPPSPQYQPGLPSSKYQAGHLSPQHFPSRTPNHLTGGYTSPYFYYEHQLNHDFPAGFAYPGLPLYGRPKAPPPPETRYPHSTYVIGQAR